MAGAGVLILLLSRRHNSLPNALRGTRRNAMFHPVNMEFPLP